MKKRRPLTALILVALMLGAFGAMGADADDEPWIITTPVVITEPAELEDIILLDGGSLTVRDLPDRIFRLVNSSVDTWNFYPQTFARVTIRDSVVGEVLSMGDSRVIMERVTVDGTGGFFGARDTSRITATECTFTCTIESTQEATIILRESSAGPYPIDPTGAYTRFGAYDRGRLFADQTVVFTTPALADQGLIAVSYLDDPPNDPPGPSGVTLTGTVAQFSLDPEVSVGSWRLEASGRDGGAPTLIGHGEENVEGGSLGVWSDADPVVDHRLQTTLSDGLGRTLVGNLVVPGSNPRVR